MAISLGDETLALTTTDLQLLQVEAQQQGELICRTTEFGNEINLPRKLGEAGDRIFQLRDGLTLSIRSGQLWQPLVIEKQHQETFPVIAKFYLSGSSRVKTPQVPEIIPDYAEVAGHNYIYHLPDMTEYEQWQSDSFIQVIYITANLDYFRTFGSTNNKLPTPLNALMRSQRFHQPLGKMTPAMTQLLQQIIHCPYQGMTQQIYLESKALELLALQFACLESDPAASRQCSLKAEDLERVQYARDILIQRSSNPPSLIELSRLVELNDRKLKQGFRQLFNNTVFGYLRDYRMKQAQHLLAQSQMTIAQVANKVGYGNPEAFSTAFKRKFSVSPKAYQLGKFE